MISLTLIDDLIEDIEKDIPRGIGRAFEEYEAVAINTVYQLKNLKEVLCRRQPSTN